MANRLKLDFSIDSIEDRRAFIESYLPNFSNPTEDELEMMANYILWGKQSNGLNVVQSHEIEIETRNKTWAATDKVESLDALLEQPTFNENQLRTSTAPPLKVAREVFDRVATLEAAPDHLKSVFEDLFLRIDVLELGINFYDLAHSKRTKPPRAELLNKFKPEEVEDIKVKAEKWTQFFYLKRRHLLVELRREQFTLRDSFCTQIQRHSEQSAPTAPDAISLDSDIVVLPLGTIQGEKGQGIWRPLEDLVPKNFGEEDLEEISKFYWKKKKEEDCSGLKFDFRDEEQIYQLFLMVEELEEDMDGADNKIPYQGLVSVIQTLRYYTDISDLTDLQKDILEMKIKGKRNSDISWYINKTYQKTYSDNYISTLFKQKILKQITETVKYHLRVVENLWFEEEFKVCTSCGRTLLRDTVNFMHKSRSKDGFNSRCKVCDKKARQSKMRGEYNGQASE